jgi:hypothetical protein
VKWLLVAILVPLFALGTILSPLMLLIRPSMVFQAMNRLCGAAYLGFDGRSTISKSCGLRLAENPECQPCKRICAALALLDPEHCPKEISGD